MESYQALQKAISQQVKTSESVVLFKECLDKQSGLRCETEKLNFQVGGV